MKTVLLTGFEPFGQDTINPSLEAVKALHNTQLDGGNIVACQVPVTRYEAFEAVKHAIEQHQPDVVICVGQAAGRKDITPERVAVNIDDYRIPDNGNNQPIDETVLENGPVGYFTSLPIKAICRDIQQAQLPASVSNTAGTFVCNHLFYLLMNHIEHRQIRGGFVHIPLIPEQSDQHPSLPLEAIIRGLKIAAQSCIDNPQDIEIGGGTIC